MIEPSASAIQPPTPAILYEYQNKGVTKFAFCKWLILKGAICLLRASKGEIALAKKKSGSELPHSKHSFIQG